MNFAIVQRLLRVARLDATAFLEVRDDPAATVPAILVVAVSSILSGIGGWLLYLSLIPAVAREGSRFFINSVIVSIATNKDSIFSKVLLRKLQGAYIQLFVI